MTAPGILPVVISLRTASPIRLSAAREKVGSACTACSDPAARRMASAARTRWRLATPLVLHRFIDKLLQGPLDALTFRRRLLQDHEEHLLLAVDHHVAAAGAVPFQFAERSRRRRFCVTWIGADG